MPVHPSKAFPYGRKRLLTDKGLINSGSGDAFYGGSGYGNSPGCDGGYGAFDEGSFTTSGSDNGVRHSCGKCRIVPSLSPRIVGRGDGVMCGSGHVDFSGDGADYLRDEFTELTPINACAVTNVTPKRRQFSE